jgi:hypothetical protein
MAIDRVQQDPYIHPGYGGHGQPAVQQHVNDPYGLWSDIPNTLE